MVATRNAGKLAEFRRLLVGLPWHLLDMTEAGVDTELDEPGPGYLENAGFKATTVCAATGMCVLADDSGIEIPALRGWPGPLSARWLRGSDRERLDGLLAEVERRSPDDRRARYVAVVAMATPSGGVITARGQCDGVLVTPRGDGGFGYDPAFLSEDLGVTFGEAAAREKDGVSHRARALARLAESGVLDWPGVHIGAPPRNPRG